MRTQKKNIFKTVGLIAMTLFLVSCGKDNKSGGDNWGGFGNYNLNPQSSASAQQALQAARATCGMNHQVLTQQVQVAGQGTAIGVTSNGDYAQLVAVGNGTGTLSIGFCPRNGVTIGQIQIRSTGYITPSGCQGLYYFNGLLIDGMVQNGYNNGGYNGGYYGGGYVFNYAFRSPFQTGCNSYSNYGLM